jgi:Ran GTPase-activating protein (RanGAP) involved in mRNA processing and transport
MIALDKSNKFTPQKYYYGVGCFNTSTIQRNDKTFSIYEFLIVTPSYEDALYALKSNDKLNCIYKFFFPKDSASKYLVNIGKYNPYIGENITIILNGSNFVIDKVLKQGGIYIINLFPYEYRTHYTGSYGRIHFGSSKYVRYSKINFKNCHMLLNLKPYKIYKSIQKIAIQRLDINDNQFKQLLNLIKLNWRFLRKLEICGCKISKQNIESLSKVLKNNKLIAVLTINNIYEFDHILMKSINQSLSFNKLIKILDLGINNLGPKGAQYVARMIRGYRFLEEISLMSNMIGDEGALAISQVLINSAENITKLNVADNKLSDVGLAYINSFIGINTSLEDLDLSHNSITDIGFKSLVDVLSLNYKLTMIDLENNKITVKGVEYQSLRLADDTLDRRIIVNPMWNNRDY